LAPATTFSSHQTSASVVRFLRKKIAESREKILPKFLEGLVAFFAYSNKLLSIALTVYRENEQTNPIFEIET